MTIFDQIVAIPRVETGRTQRFVQLGIMRGLKRPHSKAFRDRIFTGLIDTLRT